MCQSTPRWGVPITGLDRGVPHPRSGWGGYPIPVLDEGIPHPRSGQEHTSQPGPDGGGTWGTPSQVWMVGPPTPIRQSSIASTCYPTGSMPLAFTQEDFLVFSKCDQTSVNPVISSISFICVENCEIDR